MLFKYDIAEVSPELGHLPAEAGGEGAGHRAR